MIIHKCTPEKNTQILIRNDETGSYSLTLFD